MDFSNFRLAFLEVAPNCTLFQRSGVVGNLLVRNLRKWAFVQFYAVINLSKYFYEHWQFDLVCSILEKSE